ncbi:unnamed protein product [Auanema sp. JU1783]|nr:unnamed protein product [Auanema sp. JU1783]
MFHLFTSTHHDYELFQKKKKKNFLPVQSVLLIKMTVLFIQSSRKLSAPRKLPHTFFLKRPRAVVHHSYLT